MLTDDIQSHDRFVDRLFAEAPLQDLRPMAAARIEAACLARLRRRKKSIHWTTSLLGICEAALAFLLGGSYLLQTLSWALSLCGIYFG
jgi:hypothetical protein